MRKNYLWYQFFRRIVVGLGLKIFYKSYTASGRENIPDKPILFVPNHQNSFMDAFLVTCKSKSVTYFLTRAQAFNPPIMGWFLRSLNMLPVYRVRDGFSSIQKNNEIFEQCISYLKRNDDVLIFAEANHKLERRIRPLSKGFTRIAFGAEEKHNWELDLQVIPVGVNYSKHQNSRNHVHVRFGEAIAVKQFQELYLKDENAASQELKEYTSERMKQLVMHVPETSHYAFYKILLDDLEINRRILVDPDVMNQRIDKVEPHATEEWLLKAKELEKLAEKHSVNLYHLANGKRFKWWEIFLLPFYVFSLLNNIIPYQPVKYLTSKVIKDHAFDASIKFVSGLFLLPIFYLIVSAILYLTGIDGTIIWGYLALSVLTVPIFVRAKEVLLPLSGSRLAKKKPKLFEELNNRLKEFRVLRNSIFTNEAK